MAEDVSGQEAFADALSGGGEGQLAGTVDAGAAVEQSAPEPSQEAPQGASEATNGAEQPAAQGTSQQGNQNAQEREGWIPAWRAGEIAAEKRQLQAELADLRRFKEDQEAERTRKEQEAALSSEDFYGSDPDKYIDKRFEHHSQKALTPIQQEIQQLRAERQQEREESSRERAEETHGRDTVVAAWQRVDQAIRAGDPEALALKESLLKSRHPYGDLVAFDKRRSTLEAIGGDLEGYTKKQREEALKDPEFLARALEAHRSMATPVQTGVPGRAAPSSQTRGPMPSLNRQTSAADDGAEDDDPTAVFNQALNAPRARMTG